MLQSENDLHARNVEDMVIFFIARHIKKKTNFCMIYFKVHFLFFLLLILWSSVK